MPVTIKDVAKLAVWSAVILRSSASSYQMIQMLSIKIHFFHLF